VADRPQLSRAAVGVAILVLVAFAGLVAFLIGQVDKDETAWTRLAWIFASVEAIAFGAAGALFGSSIQRERAEKAEDAARTNAQDAANGRALAEAIKADAPEPGSGSGGSGGTLESLGAGQQRDAAARVAARHAELAKRLFP
jgi:uncharacterized membrane protein YsdA (DUF1294 family)